MTSNLGPEAPPCNMMWHLDAFQPLNIMSHLDAFQPLNIMSLHSALQHVKMMPQLGAISNVNIMQHLGAIPAKAMSVVDGSVAWLRLQEIISANKVKGEELMKEPEKQAFNSNNRSNVNVWQGHKSLIQVVGFLLLFGIACVDGKTLHQTIEPKAEMSRPCRINGQCPYPGSRKENVTRDNCFSCPEDQLPYCVTETNTWRIYYICATIAEMQCGSGYYGVFTFHDGNIFIEKVACGPGTFLNGSRDCRRRKCEEMPRIDEHKYTILREATFDGIPHLLTCNAENGYCVTDVTYGPTFTYTEELNYRDVCRVPASDDECVHPKGESTRDVQGDKAGNRENSAKSHVTKQKMEGKRGKVTKHSPTGRTPSLSDKQDTHGKGGISNDGLAAMIGTISSQDKVQGSYCHEGSIGCPYSKISKTSAGGILAAVIAVALTCNICKTCNKHKSKTSNTVVTLADGAVYINKVKRLTMTRSSSGGSETSEGGDSHDDFENNDDPVTETSAQPLLSVEASEDVEDVDFGGTDPDPDTGSMQSA